MPSKIDYRIFGGIIIKNLLKSQTFQRDNKEKKSITLALMTGTVIAFAITCIAFIICALLLRYTNFSENNVVTFVLISTLISVVISGFDVARSADSQGWLWGLVAGGIYAVLYICLGSFVSGGFAFDTRTITILIFAIAGGGLGGIFGINFKKK